jgi:hypothetical protein
MGSCWCSPGNRLSADDTDLYESEAAADGSFSTVARLDAISEIGLDEGYPSVSGKDKTLYFTRYTDDVTLNDIYYSVRSGGSYGLPVEVPGVNTRGYESGAVVSESALQVVFDRDDAMYLGVRTGTSDSFSVTEFKDDSGTLISGSVDWMSADGCRLYYSKATYAGDTLTSSRFYVRSRSL